MYTHIYIYIYCHDTYMSTFIYSYKINLSHVNKNNDFLLSKLSYFLCKQETIISMPLLCEHGPSVLKI